MITMRPPQQGQGCLDRSTVRGSTSAGAAAGLFTASSGRILVSFSARLLPARSP
jgi:hypothetical protein